jgi:hypothetical protein
MWAGVDYFLGGVCVIIWTWCGILQCINFNTNLLDGRFGNFEFIM